MNTCSLQMYMLHLDPTNMTLPQEIFSIVQFCTWEPFWYLINGLFRIHNMLSFLGTDDITKVPNLAPKLMVVGARPRVKLRIIFQVQLVFLVDKLAEFSQLVVFDIGWAPHQPIHWWRGTHLILHFVVLAAKYKSSIL